VIDKNEISAGEVATLTWNWTQASTAYLTTDGIVQNPKTGSLQVSPSETTEYVFVAEALGLAPCVLSRRLVVRGAKGFASDWPEDWFDPLPYKNEYPLKGASLVKTVARAKAILQELGEVRDYKVQDATVLLTPFHERWDLGRPDETPKRPRRIAYRVALSSTERGSSVLMQISAAVQWRVIIERKGWVPENASSSTIYQEQVAAIKKKILGE